MRWPQFKTIYQTKEQKLGINSAERQSDVMMERQISVSKDVSDLADADLSKLVTDLQARITNQEASQKAFVRIAQLNLFDLIS